MLGALKNLFGGGPKVDLTELIKNGAQIIDVRTKEEYRGGHAKGSVNIPLNTLTASMAKIRKDKPVITCCASGMRSGSAKRVLQSNGFKEVHNGGSWQSVQSKIR
jgi:rhodanese-related sulfurtransferase